MRSGNAKEEGNRNESSKGGSFITLTRSGEKKAVTWPMKRGREKHFS